MRPYLCRALLFGEVSRRGLLFRRAGSCSCTFWFNCSCPRLSSSQSCARKRFIRRTARSYRIRLHGLMEVLASEQRQLAGIFLIVLIVFFFVRWAACLPIRVLGLFLERLGPHGCIFGGIAVESTSTARSDPPKGAACSRRASSLRSDCPARVSPLLAVFAPPLFELRII